jgi:hypothetical protein
VTTIRERLGDKSAQLARVHAFANPDPAFADVYEILSADVTKESAETVLSPGDHFELARDVRAALHDTTRVETTDREPLAARFGVPIEKNTDWIKDLLAALLAANEADLIELAKYLHVPIPGQPGDEQVDLNAADIDAYAELVAAETAFREIVRSTIGASWTDDFTRGKLDLLEEKRAEEDKKRDGVSVSQDLLDYTEAYHLESLILKHWDKTGPILKDKKRTEVYLNLMLDVRNTIAHARPVAPFERHMLGRDRGAGPEPDLAPSKQLRDGRCLLRDHQLRARFIWRGTGWRQQEKQQLQAPEDWPGCYV